MKEQLVGQEWSWGTPMRIRKKHPDCWKGSVIRRRYDGPVPLILQTVYFGGNQIPRFPEQLVLPKRFLPVWNLRQGEYLRLRRKLRIVIRCFIKLLLMVNMVIECISFWCELKIPCFRHFVNGNFPLLWNTLVLLNFLFFVILFKIVADSNVITVYVR